MSKYDNFLKNVDFYYKGEDDIAFEVSKKYTWHLQRMLKKIERQAKAIVITENNKYSKTGRLARSIKSNGVQRVQGRRGKIEGSVSAGSSLAYYARPVHEGSVEHLITPNPPRERLKFRWDNRMGRVSVESWEPLKRYTPALHGGNPNVRQVPGGYQIKRRRWGQGPISSRWTRPEMVMHPGYKGNPFLRKATREVVRRDYGWNTPF